NDNLQSHLKTHAWEKPYQCSQCGRTFSRKYSLKMHMKTHTGEKPYQCSLCKRTFSHNDHFKSHINTHTGATSYQGSHCSNAFSQNNTLKRHLNKHTGEKPYQCSHCGKTFPLTDNLKKHLKTHIEQEHSIDSAKYSNVKEFIDKVASFDNIYISYKLLEECVMCYEKMDPTQYSVILSHPLRIRVMCTNCKLLIYSLVGRKNA
ncbi:unnamed protein product, partial [Meganyctiphanes norvegica]